MIKSNQFSYEIPEGTRKGAFNIYQGRDGAIYLLLGTVATPLTLQQVNHLSITPEHVMDYDQDKFNYHYNIEAPIKICIIRQEGAISKVVSNKPDAQVKMIELFDEADERIIDIYTVFSKNIYEHFSDHSDPIEQETYHELKNQKF